MAHYKFEFLNHFIFIIKIIRLLLKRFEVWTEWIYDLNNDCHSLQMQWKETPNEMPSRQFLALLNVADRALAATYFPFPLSTTAFQLALRHSSTCLSLPYLL